jgi:hypothetical protein
VKVYLEGIGDAPPWADLLPAWHHLASRDAVGRHRVAQDRGSADIVLTLFNKDPRYFRLPYDPRRFIYGNFDNGFPVFPGIYPSLTPRNAHPQYAQSGPYVVGAWNEDDLDLEHKRVKYLYTFVGSARTHPLRRAVLRLRHARGFLRDSSTDDAYKSNQPPETYDQFRRQYRANLAESSFVLCPRGAGVSSVRLFETMCAGRVPVVIADDWIPPSGVSWPDCILRIAEKDVETIPELLESLEGRASEMGSLARKEWEENFSEERIFDWTIEKLVSMHSATRWRRQEFLLWRARRLMARENLRRVTLPWAKREVTSLSNWLRSRVSR